MAKKERNQAVQVEMETFEPARLVEEEPLYEADAYQTPQLDEGADVTVMKTVGVGGPVPIVAPKHNTIQLQPIIVPLAVVPYMTQDSNVLRTDAKTQQVYAEAEYAEAIAFEDVVQKKKKVKKHNNLLSRVFAFVTLLISAVVVVPFILSYFMQSLGSVDLSYLNVIGAIQSWIAKAGTYSVGRYALYLATFATSGVLVLTSLIGLIVGKYPRALTVVLSLLSLGTLLGLLIFDLVKAQFVLEDSIIFVALIAICALNVLLSIIFSIVLNRAEDKKEAITSEI